MTVALILPLAIGCEVGLAGRGKWELTWYLSVLAPIANPLVGREGIVVVKKEGCVHVMGHVDLIITLEPVFPPFYWVLKKGKERKRNRKERNGGD